MQDPRLLQLALSAMHFTGVSKLLAPAFRGLGAIFMLHHVMPGGGLQQGFAPNRGLEVTPEFLVAVIEHIRSRGYDILSLAEAVGRIRQGRSKRPFAVFTLDDGYLDNLEYAVPVFRENSVPYTIFFAPEITDGRCELWWRILEEVIRLENEVVADLPSARITCPARTDAEKREAFKALYWPVRRMEEHQQRDWIRRFAETYGFEVDRYCRDVAMTWDQLRSLAADPLCTIGAHTIHHYAVAKLTTDEALLEMVGSADRIEAETGTRPRFFAYPYGDETSAGPRDFELARKAGFEAAVTTAKGVISYHHAPALMSLPRVSLNGDYQRLDFVDVLTSGVAFAGLNAVRWLSRRAG